MKTSIGISAETGRLSPTNWPNCWPMNLYCTPKPSMPTGIWKAWIFIRSTCILRSYTRNRRRLWTRSRNGFANWTLCARHAEKLPGPDALNRTRCWGNDSRSLIKKLLADHESIIAFIRGNIDEFADAHKDAGTSDYITGLMEKHEKIAWMLRAHIK